jgi:hypothetical protein
MNPLEPKMIPCPMCEGEIGAECPRCKGKKEVLEPIEDTLERVRNIAKWLAINYCTFLANPTCMRDDRDCGECHTQHLLEAYNAVEKKEKEK